MAEDEASTRPVVGKNGRAALRVGKIVNEPQNGAQRIPAQIGAKAILWCAQSGGTKRVFEGVLFDPSHEVKRAWADCRPRQTLQRRERDSNPRYGFPYTCFPDMLLQPLGHLSESEYHGRAPGRVQAKRRAAGCRARRSRGRTARGR